jgi:hypothetical protein
MTWHIVGKVQKSLIQCYTRLGGSSRGYGGLGGVFSEKFSVYAKVGVLRDSHNLFFNTV